jgi:hypothetical protein
VGQDLLTMAVIMSQPVDLDEVEHLLSWHPASSLFAEEVVPALIAEVEHLRGTVERLQVEKHDLMERLGQMGSDPS